MHLTMILGQKDFTPRTRYFFRYLCINTSLFGVAGRRKNELCFLIPILIDPLRSNWAECVITCSYTAKLMLVR